MTAKGKIDCDIEHFNALSKHEEDNKISNPAKFVKADNYNTFSTHLHESF